MVSSGGVVSSVISTVASPHDISSIALSGDEELLTSESCVELRVTTPPSMAFSSIVIIVLPALMSVGSQVFLLISAKATFISGDEVAIEYSVQSSEVRASPASIDVIMIFSRSIFR